MRASFARFIFGGICRGLDFELIRRLHEHQPVIAHGASLAAEKEGVENPRFPPFPAWRSRQVSAVRFRCRHRGFITVCPSLTISTYAAARFFVERLSVECDLRHGKPARSVRRRSALGLGGSAMERYSTRSCLPDPSPPRAVFRFRVGTCTQRKQMPTDNSGWELCLQAEIRNSGFDRVRNGLEENQTLSTRSRQSSPYSSGRSQA